MLDTLKERVKTLKELPDVGRFYFERPTTYEPAAAAKLLTPAGGARLDLLRVRLRDSEEFSPAALEALYRALTAELQVKLVDLAQLTRLAVTGRTASPPLFEVLALLGREETLSRLAAARAVAAGSTP
jgi:glutamyl-tRNA synthetase